MRNKLGQWVVSYYVYQEVKDIIDFLRNDLEKLQLISTSVKEIRAKIEILDRLDAILQEAARINEPVESDVDAEVDRIRYAQAFPCEGNPQSLYEIKLVAQGEGNMVPRRVRIDGEG